MRRRLALAFVLACAVPLACGSPDGEEDAPGSALENVRDTLGEDTTLARDDTLALPEWTTGTVRWEPPSRTGSVVVSSLRHARHEGYDRWVLEMLGDAVPGYALEYVDTPLTECGSGRQVHPVGDGWLQLRLEPAQGHTDAGEATLPRGVETPALTRGLRVYRTCDFEGTVTLVLAVDSPEPFRAFHMAEPTRVVVDVRH